MTGTSTPIMASPDRRPPKMPEQPQRLVVRVGDQLIVFPASDGSVPLCVAARSDRRACGDALDQSGHGWQHWHVPELDGEVAALDVSAWARAEFLRQRCSRHVNTDGPDVAAPTWEPFSPEVHADLVRRYPKAIWTPKGLRTIRPESADQAPARRYEEFADLIARALASRTDPPCETALYKYYDIQDRLLYVGIADGLAARIAAHVKASSWMEFAVRSTIERHPTRKRAEDAERNAIKSERPLFNSIYNDTPDARHRLVEYLIEHGRTDLLAADVSRG